MTSPTDLRTPSKYIVEYSFVFPLVQEVLKFVKEHGSYSPLWPMVNTMGNMQLKDVVSQGGRRASVPSLVHSCGHISRIFLTFFLFFLYVCTSNKNLKIKTTIRNTNYRREYMGGGTYITEA